MRIIKDSLMASTHLDSQGDRLSEEELKNIFEQIPDPYIINQGHDISKPPCGKAFNKRIKRLSDGDLAILVDLEIYDDQLQIDPRGLSISFAKKQPIEFANDANVLIRFNPHVIEKKDMHLLMELKNDLIIPDVIELRQKGLDPIHIVIIEFILISLVRGFFEEAGHELFREFKNKLITIAESHRKRNSMELIYHIIFKDTIGVNNVEVLVVVPSSLLPILKGNNLCIDTIYDFFEKRIGTSKIKKVVLEIIKDNPFFKVIHFVDDNGKAISL